MGQVRALVSGDLLANRYVLDDLVTERLGSTSWRAHDRVLERNVGVEVLPSSDSRASQFHAAARLSTTVGDPRFLQVLDVLEDQYHHIVVREWARASPLSAVLAESSLPNHRAAAVVAEVAEAMAHAHAQGVFHRRLTPHHVLLKRSGGVRIVGLGVADALAPVGHTDTPSDLRAYEQADVESLGKLLYACLVSRWPGAHIDNLRAAPTVHGQLLRPRQVRAGVARDVDAVCDQILGRPPRHHRPALTTAAEIARELQGLSDVAPTNEPRPPLARLSSPDLLRADPVEVPLGPPPGLEPPRRRPKAFEPPPPTPLERGLERATRATKGDRGLILLGLAVALVLVTILGFAVGRSTKNFNPYTADSRSESSLTPVAAFDFDPAGDKQENPEETKYAIDGDFSTAWRTSAYFGSATFGGLKKGVGLVVDLGSVREVTQVRVRLGGQTTSLSLYTARPGVDRPTSMSGLTKRGSNRDAGSDASFVMSEPVLTRYVVVWLTRLPKDPSRPGSFRGEVREVTIRGLS